MDESITQAASNKDKNFLKSLKSFIDEELSYLNPNEFSKERFLIFQQAFNQILEYVQAYKNLLGSIKKEYELCIDALEKGRLEADHLKNDLTKSVGFTTTLLNLQKRNDELKSKISELKEANRKLQTALEKVIADNEKYRPKKPLFDGKYSFLNLDKPKVEEASKEEKVDELIPGLTIDETTDLKYLNTILHRVEYKIKELSAAQNTKYSVKSRKLDLQTVLSEKVITRDNMQIKTDSLKHKLHLYKIAINAAREYYEGNTQYNSIHEALTKAIISGSLVKQLKQDDENDQVDESSLENEAEFILDYIEKFNELFENGKYKDAAYFAAASPRSVLRNVETLYRFKSVCDVNLEDNDPLLLYCSAILDSISDSVQKPDTVMSLEFVRIALAHNKIDVLTRWVAQRSLTFSYEIAKSIEDFIEIRSKYTKKGLELALFIYQDIGSVLEAAICMIKLGRIKAAMDYIKTQPDKFKADTEFYLKLLHKCPEIEFANALTESKNSLSITVEQIVSVLLDSEKPHNGLKFMKLQIDNISKEFTENLDEKLKDEYKAKKQKLKTSYETLCKFSFLTQNEDQFTKSIAAESRDHMQQLYSRLGTDRPFNSENSLSLTQTKKSDEEQESKTEKTVRFETLKANAEEKIETWSVNTLNNSELFTSSLDTNQNLKQTSENLFHHGSDNDQIKSIVVEGKENTELCMIEESSSLRISSIQTLHNDFYNKFNEEIFDDEDLN